MTFPFFVSPPPPGSNDEQRRQYNEHLKEAFGGCSLNEPKPSEGDLKVELKYALWPKKVCGKKIWLKHYEQLFEYRTRKRYIDLIRTAFFMECGGWDLIRERIL